MPCLLRVALWWQTEDEDEKEEGEEESRKAVRENWAQGPLLLQRQRAESASHQSWHW